MMGIQQDAIYGNPVMAYQNLTASMVNPERANGDTDWNAILANGIRGAAQGAIMAQVQGAYASGQLMPPPSDYRPTASGLNGLLLIAVAAFFIMGGD